jgi:hypothetical protein
MFEAHVRPLKIDKEVVWIETRCCARGALRGRLGWWRLINAVVDQMTIIVSRTVYKKLSRNLPVDCRDCVTQGLLDVQSIQRINIAVDAARLLHGRDAATHPLCAADKFVV